VNVDEVQTGCRFVLRVLIHALGERRQAQSCKGAGRPRATAEPASTMARQTSSIGVAVDEILPPSIR
jgi:hypothetical protein